MTEAEWLSCPEPRAMLYDQREAAPPWKLRRFACECCPRFWHLLDRSAQHAVACVEHYAAGQGVTKGQLKKAHNAVSPGQYPRGSPAWYLARAAQDATAVSMAAPHGSYLWTQAADAADQASLAVLPPHDGGEYRDWVFGPARRGEQAAQAALLRCILGNPFRVARFCPGWLTPDVAALLRAINDPAESPGAAQTLAPHAILADALEDAGCADEAILGHLRGPGPHARGCWVIDLPAKG